MSLQELTFESPEKFEREGVKGETRRFVTTTTADIPSRGETASSPFPSGYRYDSISYRARSIESGAQQYEVTITAVPYEYIVPEPGLDDSELIDVWEFDSTISQRNLITTSGGTATFLLDTDGEIIVFDDVQETATRIIRTDRDSVTEILGEQSKAGKINDSADDPFDGAVQYQWKCESVNSVRRDSKSYEIRYNYIRAGHDVAGNNMTWKDVAEARSDNIEGAVTFSYPEGTIGPEL